MKTKPIYIFLLGVISLVLVGCANTARGIAQDTRENLDKVKQWSQDKDWDW